MNSLEVRERGAQLTEHPKQLEEEHMRVAEWYIRKGGLAVVMSRDRSRVHGGRCRRQTLKGQDAAGLSSQKD